MTDESRAIESLDKSLETLIGDLGAMKGFNESAFDTACSALRFLAATWRGRDMVPRKSVAAILGTVDIMINVRDRYSPEEATLLCDKAAELDELIAACFVD